MHSGEDSRPIVEQLRAEGMDDTVIRARMELEGWDEADIKAAFQALPTPDHHAAKTSTHHHRRTRRRRHTVTAAIAAIAFFGVGMFGGFTFHTPPVYSISLPPLSGATSTVPELTYGALPALVDPEYYADVKNALIVGRADFITADLTHMQLDVYQAGLVAHTAPIIAKGKVGSWWETPVGIYKIETKEKDHYSTFSKVHMPWSMQFQGNFFIHGLPYYSDGTPVSSSYSGGCIRLSTEDTEEVFHLAYVGMPVIVYKESDEVSTFSYRFRTPRVAATEYLVADVNNGSVLASKNASSLVPIASITKLVTALTATEYINLDRDVMVQSNALVYTANPRLRPGDHKRAYDLLYLLLQESSNEAAEVIASVMGRDEFVAFMNAKARAIGLTRTTFADPSGAKSDMSTPEDLFTLLRYVHANRRFVFGITAGTLKDSAYGNHSFANISNYNIIKSLPASYTFVGGKVGQTNEAGETYAGVFSVPIGGVRRDIAVVVLGSTDASSDVVSLLKFVSSSYAADQ
ncbi:hypothetical protein FJY93_00540 [Candidatus Kaiserbacteria bacterium]|nr:hypothetical protein [Candidatus Kaiserbacteria bacterium]